MTRCRTDGCLVCSIYLTGYDHSKIARTNIEREDVRINSTQLFLDEQREKERKKKMFKLK